MSKPLRNSRLCDFICSKLLRQLPNFLLPKCFAPVSYGITFCMEIFWTDLLNGERNAVLSACIAYVLLMCMISIMGCLRMRRWPHTTGTLTEDGFSSIGNSEDRMQAARVRYEYSVNGIPYTGKRLSPFILYATGTKMAKWQKVGIQRHGDDRITVFYNPSRPQKSYLITPKWTGITGICVLTTMVVIVLWLAF